MALGEEGGAQLGVLHVPRYRPDHQLMRRSPARIWHRTGRLEPVLPLPKLVGQRHNGVVLDVVKTGFGRHQTGRLVAGGGRASGIVAIGRIFRENVTGKPGGRDGVLAIVRVGSRKLILTVIEGQVRDRNQRQALSQFLQGRKHILKIRKQRYERQKNIFFKF